MMGSMGKIYVGRPIKVKSRKELLATIKPNQWRYLRADTGDMPEGWTDVPPPSPAREIISLMPTPA